METRTVYRSEVMTPYEVDEKLVSKGQAGWEFAGMASAGTATSPRVVVVFKKEQPIARRAEREQEQE